MMNDAEKTKCFGCGKEEGKHELFAITDGRLLCLDCLAFTCESCGEMVPKEAHACDRCSRPVCGVCFEVNHNCCAKDEVRT